MKNFIEDLGVNGHLTIIKRYTDGEEEVVLDDKNIIVSGMGLGLSYLFSASGSDDIRDYQITKFQVGVSGPPAGGVVSSISNLSGPLELLEYGVDSSLSAETTNIITGPAQTNAILIPDPRAVAIRIPPSKITRIGDSSVRYTLVLDEETANNIDRGDGATGLNEVGLFLKNPIGIGLGKDYAMLAAYRTFSDIIKTSDFSLIFRWTINF